MQKKTLVLGASANPARASHIAVKRLVAAGHEVVPVGNRAGMIDQLTIQLANPMVEDVDTITLYVGLHNQPELYNYIVSLQPKRLIFNPGTENIVLSKLASDAGISAINACTLVMLSLGDY